MQDDTTTENIELLPADPEVACRLRTAAEAYDMGEKEAVRRAVEYSLHHHEDACLD